MSRNRYRLAVRVGQRWQPVCELDAETPADALRQAIACLPPEHFDKPIRLEPAEPSDKPTGPAAGDPKA